MSRRMLRTVGQRVQRGVVLFISLIVLVAMSLAGIALMRSVDAGGMIAGNLAFRQNTVYVADLGVEAARAWLMTQSTTTLYTDNGGDAYYATWQDTLDLIGNDPAKTDFLWPTASKPVTASPYVPPTGYNVRYVVHRLCQNSGDPTGSSANCMKVSGSAGTTASGTKGATAYGGGAITVPTSALYRVTVQVIGPRNAISYIQATVF